MRTIHLALAAIIIAISACGGKQDSLSVKKAELEKIKKEIVSLQSKAKLLETEIAGIEKKKDDSKLVDVEELTTGTFSSYLTVTGKADADQSTFATSQVPSTVTAVLVKLGDHVSAGQALALLENSALKQSRLQLEQQLAFATTLLDKQKRLWDQGVGTEVQYLSVKNQKEALEKNIATLDAQIAMYTIKSPINGTIESVETKVGHIAAPGYPMFKVVNLNTLNVAAEIAETYSGKINQGDEVTIEFPDINKNIKAKITFASKVIDPLNRTFRIEIQINSESDIKPNMIAKLKIVDYTKNNAISIPTNCIQSSEEAQYAVIAVNENGKTVAKRVNIKTGRNNLERIEVIEGLKAGDKIIINGFQELNDGQDISVNSPSKN